MKSNPNRDVFHAIADPTRRRILQLLVVAGVMTINALAANFSSSRQAVTKHLKILKQAGLVEIRSQGRERLAEPRCAGLKEVFDWARNYERFWNDKLNTLEQYLDRRKEQDRDAKT